MMKTSSDTPTNLTASPATPVMEQPMKRDDERTLAQRGEDAAQTPQRAQAAPIVRFLGVTKRYGALTVLDELDLDVAPNEKVAIIGPSGSGKSTLLRVLMTLDPLTSGMIEVDGEPLTHMRSGGKLVPASPRHLRAVRSKIGMVFQSFNLFPHMTALQNTIEAPIHSLGLARNEAVERARELLSLVGLADKCNHYPSQLSGGQQQRVAIARALAMRPKVMLFDEVTSALDPELCGEVLNVIRRLGEEHNLTMLMVTHQMGFAKDFADRVCFFSQGKIVEQGPPREFFSAPKHERTQQFLRAVREAL
jgi:polar amino acid transport system ATP-binding protein